MDKFWQGVTLAKHSNAVLKIYAEHDTSLRFNYDSQEMNYPQLGNNWMIRGKQTPVYFDMFLSPTYFYDQFINLFGYPAYILQTLGAYFGAFLLIQTCINILATSIRILELHKLAGRSANLGKILTGGIFNIFYATFARVRANE